jgi:hypothetical protein
MARLPVVGRGRVVVDLRELQLLRHWKKLVM